MNEIELRMAVNHLAFDMFHFRLYAEMYPRLYGHAQHRACYQAMVYSLLLHFRLLLHFFYGKPNRDDDCCVEHFRMLPGFNAAFPVELQTRPLWEPEMREHLNKRLAHFTSIRWRENAPSLNYYAARFREVLVLIEKFQAALSGEVGMFFTNKMSFWEAQYRNPSF